MSGFVAMHRDALDHHLLQDAGRFRAWFWLVANACWKPSRVRIKGETVELQRGDLSFSQRFLAENWGWSKSKVDRFIADLRAEGMIETRSKSGASAGHKAGQGQSIITICNYAKYQQGESDARGNREAKSGASAGQARGKEEEGNKGIRNKVSKARKRANRPESIPVGVWDDFNSQRKKLFTDTALTGLLREAAKAGWTPEAAMTLATVRGWESFNAKWVKDDGQGKFRQRGDNGRKSARQIAEGLCADIPQSDGASSGEFERLPDAGPHSDNDGCGGPRVAYRIGEAFG